MARNRATIVSIAKCAEQCVRRGFALRGHQDDSTSTAANQGSFRALVDVLTSAELDLRLCYAQVYDGAGNMVGRMTGCQARFLEAYPLATYFHYASHQLNWALAHSCKRTEICVMMENLKAVSLFFPVLPEAPTAV